MMHSIKELNLFCFHATTYMLSMVMLVTEFMKNATMTVKSKKNILGTSR